MMRHAITAVVLATALSPCAAQAQEKCGALQLLNTIQMVNTAVPNIPLIPITINGATKYFFLSTASALTAISKTAADELNLPVRQSNLRTLAGTSAYQTTIPGFTLGRMQSGPTPMLVNSQITSSDGVFGMDYIQSNDADFDFAADRFQMFSPNHCPGGVVYWPAPTLAVIPILMKDGRITIPVSIDGKEITAVINTAENDTVMQIDVAKRQLGLTMGEADTPQGGALGGNPDFPIYSHTFKSLTFGGVIVSNPTIFLIPNTAGRGNLARHSGSLARAERDLIAVPEMTIGMNVLRQLHVYFAFKEGKMYVTSAAPLTEAQRSEMQNARNTYISHQVPTPQAKKAYRDSTLPLLKGLGANLALYPDNARALNGRCSLRASIKVELEGALDDCERALKLAPGTPRIMQNKAFVLYQLGRPQDAITIADAILAKDPDFAEALFLRGHAKGKVGDQPGMVADIAAAKKIDANVAFVFSRYDTDLQ